MPLVQINGEPHSLSDGETLQGMLERLGFNGKPVVCEVNLEIVSRESWGSRILSEGDRIEIIGFVGGGAHPVNRVIVNRIPVVV